MILVTLAVVEFAPRGTNGAKVVGSKEVELKLDTNPPEVEFKWVEFKL